MIVNNKTKQNSSNKDKSTGQGQNTKIGRFPFHVFHTVIWNVEHISPQNPKKKSEIYERLCKLKEEYKGVLPKEVEALYKKMDVNRENLDILDNDSEFRGLLQELMPDKEHVMGMKNLTLLTEHDNKGIGNKLYFDKRNKLNKYQAQGSFIPAATLNVFSKWHTEHPDGFVFWDTKDQDAYIDAIEKIITDFENFCQDNGSI